MSRHLFVMIFEPAPGAVPRVDELLRSARARAERPIFENEIEQLRSLSRRFEPVRSLVEYPLESGAA